VAVYLASQTQWVYAGMGQPVGLNYPGVAVVMDGMALKGQGRREAFDGVQVMERTALEEMNKGKP
jgi:hypothetical protein